MTDTLRYPVGPLTRHPTIDAATRAALIADIEQLPEALGRALAGLNDAKLDTPYREGGWTVRQVVHHVADSHMNAYIRMRLAATEDSPTIKPYDEVAWAEQSDAQTGDINLSVPLIDALHRRWSVWLRQLPASGFARTVVHPESGTLSIDGLLQIYGWHSRHHVAHITGLRKRLGW